MKNRLFFPLVLSIGISATAFAQDDLMKELEGQLPKEKDYVTSTFKGTRLVNFHTIETLSKGSLDFRISHRFGDLSSGIKNLYGLDGPATLRLGLDYSFSDRLVVGFGRTSYRKMLDGFIKYKFIRQEVNGRPYSLVGLASINLTTEDDPTKALTGIDRYDKVYSRVAYMTQLLIARKFNSKLSLQVAPTFIHYNLVTRFNDKNDLLALALSGRYKVTGSMAITAEYGLRVTRYTAEYSNYHNAASIGLDIETGGHVFQLFFTNASAINETQLIPFTTSTWTKNEFRFGFNISRVFEMNHTQ